MNTTRFVYSSVVLAALLLGAWLAFGGGPGTPWNSSALRDAEADVLANEPALDLLGSTASIDRQLRSAHSASERQLSESSAALAAARLVLTYPEPAASGEPWRVLLVAADTTHIWTGTHVEPDLPDGRATKGPARVIAARANEFESDVRQLIADDSGLLVSNDLPAGSWWGVLIAPRGYIDHFEIEVPEHGEVRIERPAPTREGRAVRLTGTVVHAQSGAPLAGARIELCGLDRLPRENTAPLPSATSDRRGVWTLQVILDEFNAPTETWRPAPCFLRASMDGYLPELAQFFQRELSPQSELDSLCIRLMPQEQAGKVVGRLVDVERVAAAGLKVSLAQRVAPHVHFAFAGRAYEATTEVDGGFEFAGLVPGSYALHVSAEEDGASCSLSDVVIAAQCTLDLGDLTLIGARKEWGQARLEGRLLTCEGLPPDRAKVLLEGRELAIDAEGQFVATELAAGMHFLELRVGTQLRGRLRVILEDGVDARMDLNLPSTSHFLGGRMLDRDAPAQGVKVRSYQRQRIELSGFDDALPSLLFLECVTETDAEGRFRLLDLPAGPIEIEASSHARGLQQTWEDVEVDRENVVFELDSVPIVRVHGVVSDAAGRPLEGVTISPRSPRSPNECARSDAAGRYELSMLVNPERGATLHASRPGYLLADQWILAGQFTTDGQLLLHWRMDQEDSRATVRGLVYDERGDGLRGVDVTFVPSEEGREGEWTATSDVRGRFACEGLPPGAYAMYLHLEDDQERRMDFRLEAGEERSIEVELRKLRSRKYTVRLMDEHDEPVVGAQIYLSITSSTSPFPEFSDATGRVELALREDVLAISVRDEGRPFQRFKQNGWPATDEEIVLRLCAGVRDREGRVVSHLGQPLPGVQLLVEGHGLGGGEISIYASSDEEGRFVLKHLPRGSLTLRAELMGHATKLIAIEDREGQIDVVMTELVGGE